MPHIYARIDEAEMSSGRASKGACPPFWVDILPFLELIAIAADASCNVHT